jgi:hypothetical protein
MRWVAFFFTVLNYLTIYAGIQDFTGYETPPDSVLKNGKIIIRHITFTGNKITKDRILQRELIVKENDTIALENLSAALQQSRKNLVNTSLFNFVTYDSLPVEGHPDQLDLNFEFIERWYVWPVPIFEFADRNFNEWFRKKDWSRLNYGLFLTWNNFRGRREKLIVFARFGYEEKYELAYQIPYINRKQTWGLGFSGGFSQNHEIAYNSFDTIYDPENGEPELEGNREFYYKSENLYPKKEYFAYAESYYRKGIHNLSWFKLGYTDLQLSDSVLFFNSDYSYGSATRNQFLSFYYQFRSDYRDYKQYPLNGYYFDCELDKKGLGFFNNPEVNSLSIKLNFRKYYRLKGRLYYAAGITGKISPFWHQPYYYQQGLGYGRDVIRGYEYYVVDGQHFGVWKNNLKFELVPTRVKTFNFIPTEKFSKLYYAIYLNVYSDFGYSIDNRSNVYNPLSNEILVGYGIGLDFVTYYDFVIRFEYSFNKMGESGFFIHFMPSI